MKNINDYKGTKTAIHCKTQDEWDKISELLGYEWVYCKWDTYSDKSCINTVDKGYSGINFYTEENYTIIHASDFMPTPRTIKQIETELEVLRAELTILKAEAKKKPIEFVKWVRTEAKRIDETVLTPSCFKNVILLHKGINTELDLIKAYNDDESSSHIYLGHWNDGIK